MNSYLVHGVRNLAAAAFAAGTSIGANKAVEYFGRNITVVDFRVAAALGTVAYTTHAAVRKVTSTEFVKSYTKSLQNCEVTPAFFAGVAASGAHALYTKAPKTRETLVYAVAHAVIFGAFAHLVSLYPRAGGPTPPTVDANK